MPSTARKTPLPRGAATAHALQAIRLLVARRWRPGDLAVELDVSRRTILRLLSALADTGLRLKVDRDGTMTYYSLDPAEVREKMGI